ncbi:hypothetical protein BJ138DRAFT_995052 [Hygrophoropsis aurantiaca]|uniref:Uncharacterized protein n=1 Tax=Hygrophoropsis aurantiaca TaxID=72124 RepID=A0ACB8AWB2_9AGAM|nr:hypothetical protein BJ138DRAFT_995052 [Hygrophoropsis aurantiaca]
MDYSTFDVSDKLQESNMAAKQRFESFKLGGGAPLAGLPHNLSKHSHGRSRSRNNSISSISTLSLSTSTSVPSLPSSNDFSSNAILSNGPPKRPNSHHRRRSSVSTRRESAELMGVSLPDLPVAHSDDNINLGDKDSIRRRALWALEGKPDLAFSKVEIPDMSTPDLSKAGFEFPTKPSFPAGSGFSGSLSSMGKRDSFKLLASSSSSKDQLHTLVEEEEEEEEQQDTMLSEDVVEPPAPEILVSVKAPLVKSPSRPRPKSLNLRPLSLCAGTLVNCAPGNLPTPTLTPSPRPSGLRTLALSNSDFSDYTNSRAAPVTRQSVTSSPTGFFGAFARRASFNFQSDSPASSPSDIGTKRRSSISYKRSGSTSSDMGVLPTPEMTPTERRFSETSDTGSLVEQPLTASEQHFLFKSHNVLLSRITDLERALRSRSSSRSRPLSIASDVSSEPSDEMLQLIADLKAERDELKKDVDGWRMRVADADKQTSVLAKRVESERRDAWVARSRLGLLEVEKGGLEKSLNEKVVALEQASTDNAELKREREGMKNEIARLNARLQDAEAAVDECLRLRAALDEERTRRAELERLLDEFNSLPTPTIAQPSTGQVKGLPTRGARRGLGFQSVDSESSSTDVESVDDSFNKAEWTLNAVAEEEEEEDTCSVSDEDNGLAGYEDEDDSDISFQSPGGSSIGSEDEMEMYPRRVLPVNEAMSRSNDGSSPPIPPRPSHASSASLSKTWTFPRGQSVPSVRREDEVDRFFGCLDDLDNSPPMGSFGSGHDTVKSLFAAPFGQGDDDGDDDDLPPFLLPSDVGVVVEVPASRSLDVVLEEEEEEETEGADDADDEDELCGEEVEGGIRFTFNVPSICITPPPTICITPPAETERLPALSLSRKPAPVYQPFDEEEEDESFTFPQAKADESFDQSAETSFSSISPSSSGRSSSRTSSSPSSIPRSTALRSFTSPLASSTPPRALSARVTPPSLPNNAFVTPPSRRGGTMPSFIPQPISPSPSKCFTPSKMSSSLPVLRSKQGTISTSGAYNGSKFKPQLKLSMTNNTANTPRCTEFPASNLNPDVKDSITSAPATGYPEYPIASSSSLSSIMSSPLAARLSFQTLSNFIPLSWTPGAAAVVACIAPSHSSEPSLSATLSTPLASDIGSSIRSSTERKHVSRDKQLEKLRRQLDHDHRTGSRCLAVHACNCCHGGDVFF